MPKEKTPAIKEFGPEIFVRFMIDLGLVNKVNDEGYICGRYDQDGQIVNMDVNGTEKPLMVIQEKITDKNALVINPMYENMTETRDARWFYIYLCLGLVLRITELADFVSSAIDESKEDEESFTKYPAEVMAFLSKHKDFDGAIFDDFITISKERRKFMNVWYDRRLKQAKFRCAIFTDDIRVEHPKIKTKSWKIMIKFMSDILGISTDLDKANADIQEKYTAISELLTVPKLESILTVYLKLYTHLNKYFDMCGKDDDNFVVDVTTLGHHISNIEEYHRLVKWVVPSTSTNIPSNFENKQTGIAQTESSLSNSNIPPNPFFNQPQERRGTIPPNPYHHETQYPQQRMPQQGMGYGTGIPVNTGMTMNTGIPINTGNYNYGGGIPVNYGI